MRRVNLRLLALLLCAAMLLPMIPAATAVTAEAKSIEEKANHTELTPAYDEEAQNKSTAITPYQFSTFEQLKELCSGTYEPDTFFNWSGNATEFVFTESLTIPENVSLHLVNVKVVIPEGVVITESTDRWSKNISGGLVVHGVYNCGTNSLEVGKELTVTGSMNINTSIFMDKDTVVSGVNNIHFASSDQKLCYSYGMYSDSELHAALAKASEDTLGIEYRISLHLEEDVTFSKSFTIPSNTTLWITGGVVHTLPSSKTITVNGSLQMLDSYTGTPVLKVEGKLVNNNTIDLQSGSVDAPMMIVTGTYSGKGTIEVGCSYLGVDFHWTDIVTGLNSDNMEVKGGPPIYIIRDVSHLTRLSAPKNLTWHVNTETVYDDSGKGSLQLVTRMGAISWETGEIRDPYFDGYYNTNYFVINLYRDGEAVLSHYGNIGFSDYYEKKGFPTCMEIPPNIEWESGTYYFTVQAVPNPMATDSEYRASVVATSENWVYTKPANLDAPTNLTWNWPTMTWSSTSVKHKTEIEVEYAPTLNDEFQWAPGGAIYNNVTNEYTLTEYDLQNAANMCGAGYYRFRVRSRSLDITKNYHSAWSDYSDTYYFDGKYEAPEEEEIPLVAPTLKASNVTSTGKIKLTWDAVPGAAKYQVYRATSKTGTYSLLKTLTGTSLTNTSTTVGKTYYYKIRAVDANGNKSDFSSIVSRTCDLPQPTGLTATNVASSGKVKLSWTAVEGAAKYEVYRATSKDGTYSLLKTLTGTSLTNTSTTAGTTYYYKVKAIHSNSAANSAYSSVVSRACDLPQPTGLTATNVASTGKVKLTWTAVEGAAKYEVYRATSKSGTYSKIYTTTGTSLTNTSVEVGTTYYYKVKAIHSNSAANSAYSAIVSRTCDLPQPKVTVTNVASTGKVKLSWTAVDGASKYEIYRATSKDGTYTKLSTTTGTSLTNTSTTAGTTYYYKVKAIHSNSAANSAYSSIVSRTCDLAQPTLTVKLNSSGKPVLTWTKVEGAVSYKVYRATSKTGTYSLLKTLTGTSLTNTSVTAGKTYYYKVIAIHSNTAANSAYSAIKSVTVK